MDKAIFAEYLPVYGWTKVKHTSKFPGGALAKARSYLSVVGNAAYIKYDGRIVYMNDKCRRDFPELVKKMNPPSPRPAAPAEPATQITLFN